MFTVSIIISTYNWPEALNLCLLSLKRQSLMPLEVIIADDGSRKETTDLIKRLQVNFPVNLTHVWHEDLGFRKSIILNKAIKTAKGAYIIQVDGDVITDKNFIKDHVKAAEKGFFVRGTRAHIKENYLVDIFKKNKVDFNFLSFGIINRFNAIRFPLLAFFAEKKRNNATSVRGSNLAYWKTDFELINGYNNYLEGWGHEDEELAARFINNKIIKKIIKLTAVQYHLSHPAASRDNEPAHVNIIKTTLIENLKICTNGYAES